MAVRSKNAHWKLAEIKAGHWDAVARMAGLDNATEIFHDIAVQTPRIIAKVNLQLPKKFPAGVRDKIFEGLQRMAARLDGGS